MLPTFRDNLLVPSSRVKQYLDCFIVQRYRSVHNVPEERMSRRVICCVGVYIYYVFLVLFTYKHIYIHVLTFRWQSCVASCTISSVKTCLSDLFDGICGQGDNSTKGIKEIKNMSRMNIQKKCPLVWVGIAQSV